MASPLPGCVPYENRRPIVVPGRFSGATAIDFLTGRFPHLQSEHWLSDFALGRMLLQGVGPIGPQRRLHGGQILLRVLPDTVEPRVHVDVGVVYDDADFRVFDKSAPLPMHACGRFNRNTLAYLIGAAFPDQRLRICHRLDADTSGIVLLAKHRAAARHAREQFESRKVGKLYLALVQGEPEQPAWSCHRAISRTSRDAGARALQDGGQPAVSDFWALGEVGPGTGRTLILAAPRTGRTHQLRLHLADAGLPIVGDPAYGEKVTTGDGLVQSGIRLHAWIMRFGLACGRTRDFRARKPAWAGPAEPSATLIDSVLQGPV